MLYSGVPGVAQARCACAAEQTRLYPGHVVFLDETWASTNMTLVWRRSPISTRCLSHAPYGHWQTTAFVCALRTCGLVAPCVLDGLLNGSAFRAWVQQALVPVLKSGDIVVLDNLSLHKVAGIADAIEAVGPQVRYLPPYSPEMAYQAHGVETAFMAH